MSKTVYENEVVEKMGSFFTGHDGTSDFPGRDVWYRGLTESRLKALTAAVIEGSDRATVLAGTVLDRVPKNGTCGVVDGVRVSTGTAEYLAGKGIGIPPEGKARVAELKKENRRFLVTAINGYAAGVVVL